MKFAVNPVGEVRKDLLQAQVEDVIKSWKDTFQGSTWWSRAKGAWINAVHYILSAGDYFIREIDQIIDAGPDKKATVLDALSKVYDSIVPGLMPLYLRPFSSKIKSFVIDVLASILVDFIVSKYRNGNWVPQTPSET